MRLEFSARAEADLGRILEYIAQKADRETAWRYGVKIRDECFRICLAPGKGKRHPIHSKLRKIVVGSHKIFYRTEPDRILIHRIWDGRRGSEPKLTADQSH